MSRRALLLAAVAGVGAATFAAPAPAQKPRILVYRGPASLPGCPEAVAASLLSTGLPLELEFCGPNETFDLTPESLEQSVAYVQPGGATIDEAWPHLEPHAGAVRDFVAAGGAYLGYCLGGYLASERWGFGVLGGDAFRHAGTPGALVEGTEPVTTTINWRGQPRSVFFQDSPEFRFDPQRAADIHVLANYPNGAIAAAVAPFGKGITGVVGPHPEATHDWYSSIGAAIPDPEVKGLSVDLALSSMTRAQLPH